MVSELLERKLDEIPRQISAARALPEKLKKLPMKDWLHLRLTVSRPPEGGFGMYGSGMFIANPPWTLAESMAPALECLADRLRVDDQAVALIEAS